MVNNGTELPFQVVSSGRAFRSHRFPSKETSYAEECVCGGHVFPPVCGGLAAFPAVRPASHMQKVITTQIMFLFANWLEFLTFIHQYTSVLLSRARSFGEHLQNI